MKEAVLLLNMGGPSNLDEVELFLRNMFADENILPMHPKLRAFVGKRIVASRLEEAKENYRALGGKSPLLEITQSLAKKLETLLHMPVYPVMRYVPPFAKEVLMRCKEQGIEKLTLFPMYPHYSTTTVKSSVDDIEATCEAIDYKPSIETIAPYFDRLGYIKLCAQRITEALEGASSERYDLLLSAHGLPVKIVQAGDPYEKQIEGNVAALKLYFEMQGVRFHDIKLVYQSRVGKGKWLEPNLADVLRHPTHRRVVIYPLSFTIDNSETMFELDVEHREIAEKIGYEDYRVARCFNDDDAHAEMIAALILERSGEDGRANL